MEILDDFSDLFTAFNAHGVDYIIVGSYALAWHGVPRMTGDIDVYIKPNAENAYRILTALQDFGFPSDAFTLDDLTHPGMIMQLGVAPVRIDILTSIDGVDWDACARNAVDGFFGDIPVRYLGRDQLIANKRASGRPKDLADLDLLEP